VKHFDAVWFCYCAPLLFLFSLPNTFLPNTHSHTKSPKAELTSACPAAPVHQVQEYYRYGQVDDCLGHWSKLWACLKQRTKFAEEVLAFLSAFHRVPLNTPTDGRAFSHHSGMCLKSKCVDLILLMNHLTFEVHVVAIPVKKAPSPNVSSQLPVGRLAQCNKIATP